MTEKEILEKILEQVKNVEGEEITLEDAKAAYDFIKDQTDFDLCQVIKDAIEGHPEQVRGICEHIEKMNKMPLYIAGGVVMATVAVLAAPVVLASLPVLSGAGAAAGGTALAVDVVGTTALPAVIGTAVATTEAAGLTVVAGGMTAGATAATVAGGAAVGVGATAAGAAAAGSVGAVAKKAAATGVGVGTAALATEGVSKSLSKKNVISALSTTLLVADICEAIKEVAYYDVAINQGNSKLLEANHKINPVFEEALWEVMDYDTQMYFVNTELSKYKCAVGGIKDKVTDIDCIHGGFEKAIVVYSNIVTKQNKMYMYVIMLNGTWFTAKDSETKLEAVKKHCQETLEKNGIYSEDIAYISLSTGKTTIIDKEFLKGKDIVEPLNYFYEGSRLRIPDLEATQALTRAGEGDAVAKNTIVGGVISNLNCEYVLNNLDKSVTVYKFTGESKAVKEAIPRTVGILEFNSLLCGPTKIRHTFSKLKSKIGTVDSVGLIIAPEVGLATVNVLSGDNVLDTIISGGVDKGLIATFTSAAGISFEASTMQVNTVYIFWTLLGGKEVILNSTNLTDGQLAVVDRNQSNLRKNILITKYHDKEGKEFYLGSERFGIFPKHCKMVASYLSDNEKLRLTHRTMKDSVFLETKNSLYTFNSLTSQLGQGSFMKPKNTVNPGDSKVKKIITPNVIYDRIKLMGKTKYFIPTVTVLVHDKTERVCHLFDYSCVGKDLETTEEEFKEFGEFPFTINGESIIANPDRYDIFYI